MNDEDDTGEGFGQPSKIPQQPDEPRREEDVEPPQMEDDSLADFPDNPFPEEESPEEIFRQLQEAKPDLDGMRNYDFLDNEAVEIEGQNTPLSNPANIQQKTTPTQRQKHLPLLPYINLWAFNEDSQLTKYIVHGSQGSSSNSSSSSSSPSSNSSNQSSIAPSPNSSSKTAIVRVLIDGEIQNIGWFCAEEPESRFFDTLTIPVKRRKMEMVIPDEFLESCEDIIAISALGNRPSCFTARVVGDKVLFSYRKPLFGRRPTSVNLRIQGKRKDCFDERWQRFTDDEREANDIFWGMAHGGR